MIDRLALGFSRAADIGEYLVTDAYWISVSVLAVPILACIAAVALS